MRLGDVPVRPVLLRLLLCAWLALEVVFHWMAWAVNFPGAQCHLLATHPALLDRDFDVYGRIEYT
jgi:hypothetical protein